MALPLVVALFLSMLPLGFTSQPVRAEEAGTVYYVSPQGDDAWSGKLEAPAADGADGPFRTIQRAAELAEAGDTVVVRAGVYRETVTPAHSGEPERPIVFKTYPGEDVTVSGADIVTGWSKEGAVYAASGVAGFDSAINQAEQVFVDGRMIHWARYPNTGPDVSRPTLLHLDGADARTTAGTVYTDRLTVYDDALTQPEGFWNGMQIAFLPKPWYQYVTGTVIASKPGSLVIEYNKGAADSFIPVAGDPYYLEGGSRALDAPGEWYLDESSGTLYARMPGDDHPDNHLVEIKRRDYAFNLDRRHHIAVQGFKLFAATVTTDTEAGDGRDQVRQFSVAPAHHILIDGIRASYVTHFTDQTRFVYSQWSTNTGIVLSGSDNEIRNSIVSYSAGNGITVIGERNKVVNNIVHDANYRGTEAANINTGFQNTTNLDHEIAYNTVYNSGRFLISFRSLKSTDRANPARLHHNDAGNPMLLTKDGGSFYTAQSNDGEGTRIDHNFIHDSFEIGIYMDNSVRDYVIDHNVVWSTPNPLTLNFDSQEMAVYNNTLLSLGTYSINTADTNSNHAGNAVRNNIVNAGIRLGKQAVVENNLTKETDPLFADFNSGNFSLTEGSPAIDAGVPHPPLTDGYSGEAPDLGAFEFDPAAPGIPNFAAGSSLPLPVPPPADLTVEAVHEGSVDLHWRDVTSDETSFLLERSVTGSHYEVIAALPPNTTSYTDTAAGGGDAYYRVRTNHSPYSNMVVASSPKTALSRTPAASFDAYGGGDNAINVFGPVGGFDNGNWLRYDNIYFPEGVASFTANVGTGETSVPHLEVWAGALPVSAGGDGSGVKIADLAVQSTGDWGVYQDQTTPLLEPVTGLHTIYILCVKDMGNIASWQFDTASTGVLRAPSALAAVPVSADSIELHWTDRSTSETQIKVERSDNGIDFIQIAVLGPDAETYTATGLEPERRYFFRVRASSPLGNSGYSNTADAIASDRPPEAPAAPTGLTAAAATHDKILLGWQDNAMNETHYRIERRIGADGEWQLIAMTGTSETGYADSGLSDSTRYDYRVSAVNPAGSSEAVTATAVTPARDSELSAHTADFDRNTPLQADIRIGVAYNGNTLDRMVLTPDAAELSPDADYTIEADALVLRKEFLARLPVGTSVLQLDFSEGADPQLAIRVTDTTLSRYTASFDLNPARQADVKVAIGREPERLAAIRSGDAELVRDADYTVSGREVSIRGDYFADRPAGDSVQLVFDFEDGSDATLTVRIEDTTPIRTVLLSRNKPVTADSIAEGWMQPGWVVDGDLNTKWDSANGGDHWLQIDLGEPALLQKFVVKHQTAIGSGASEYNTIAFQIQTSDDGAAWTDRADVTGNHAGETVHFITPVQARFVRLYITEPSQWDGIARIREFEVYGAPKTQEELLSQGKPVTADSVYEGWIQPGWVTDGNPETKWDSANGGEHWLQIDLLGTADISSFTIKHNAYLGGPAEYNTVDYRIQTSVDGTVWTDRAGASGNWSPETTHTISSVAARYVRMMITGASRWDGIARIREFEVWGKAAPGEEDKTPPANAAVTINGDAPYANQAAAVLQLAAEDEGPLEMLVSGHADFRDAAWKPFQASLPYDLGEGDGEKTVYAKFRDAAGNESPAVSDGILLDTAPPVVTFAGQQAVYELHESVGIACEAQDALSGIAAHTCEPIGGRAYDFGPGTHTFAASAADRAGNESSAAVTFSVDVTYGGLSALVKEWTEEKGVAGSLIAKLEAAEAAQAAPARDGKLESFIHEVRAQSGKHIETGHAALLAEWAEKLKHPDAG